MRNKKTTVGRVISLFFLFFIVLNLNTYFRRKNVVAVHLAGLPRSFRETAKLLEKDLFSVNTDYEFHIYISTSSSSELPRNLNSSFLLEDLEVAYSFPSSNNVFLKKVQVLNYSTYEFSPSKFIDRGCCIWNDLIYFRWEECNEQRKMSGIQYDLIVQLRLDAFFTKPLILQNLIDLPNYVYFILGANMRNFIFSNRDWDFGILGSPSAIEIYNSFVKYGDCYDVDVYGSANLNRWTFYSPTEFFGDSVPSETFTDRSVIAVFGENSQLPLNLVKEGNMYDVLEIPELHESFGGNKIPLEKKYREQFPLNHQTGILGLIRWVYEFHRSGFQLANLNKQEVFLQLNRV